MQTILCSDKTIYLQDFVEEGFEVIHLASLRTSIARKSSAPAKSPWHGADMVLLLKDLDAVHCYSLQNSYYFILHLLFSAFVLPCDSKVLSVHDQADPFWHEKSKEPVGTPRCRWSAPTVGHFCKHREAGQRPFFPSPLTNVQTGQAP